MRPQDWKTPTGQCERPRPIVVKFLRFKDKVAVLERDKNLRGTWIDGSIRAKLKARTTALNPGKVTGNITDYKQCSYSLRKAIKQAKPSV